ncbi:MAG: phosphate signaling complex protein PhoU [Anaerolineales bacterium]
MTTTSRAAFNRTLDEIRDSLLRIGALADQALERAMDALAQKDQDKARQVVEGDDQINQLRFQVEDGCLALIARQQPAAGDLRKIVAALNIVLDLERIGDYAAGIAKTCLRLNAEAASPDVPDDLWRMAQMSRSMLELVLEAYARSDEAAAESIAARDEEIDEQYQVLFSRLMNEMSEGSWQSAPLLYFLFAGHNLERVADRVTNIAERVVFMSRGTFTELNTEQEEPAGLE